MAAKSLGVRVFKALIVATVVYFLLWSVWENWGRVRAFEWSVRPLPMTAAVIMLCMAYAVLPLIWRLLLRRMGYAVRFRDAWNVFFIGNLGRYLPGKVWTIAGMAYLAERIGVPAAAAAASAILAQVYSLLSAVVFFILFFIFSKEIPQGWLWGIVPLFVLAAAVFMVPGNLERGLNVVLRRLGRRPLRIGLTVGDALVVTAWYFGSGVLFGLGFWLFVTAFAGWGAVNPLVAASGYIIAYWVGFLAFFVPGGFGVREGALGVMFSPVLPPGVLIIIAALLRLVVTAIELMYVAVAFVRKDSRYGKKTTFPADAV